MKNKKLLALVLIVSISTTASFSLKSNRVYADSTSNEIQNVTRLGGTNRFGTSSKIAEYGWKQSDNVVLANAQGDADFPDALAGTPLAYSLNAPMLLTNVTSTPDEISNEISKLKAKNIYILGGTGVVSQSQEDIFKFKGYAVTRISGATRYDTAVKIADELNNKSKVSKIYMTTSSQFQYTLAAAPYAARENAAILFTDGDILNQTTESEILKLGVKDVEIIGGSDIVSSDVDSELKKLGLNVSRVEGNTPEEVVSNLINQNKDKISGIALANNSMFPDALSGAVLSAKNNMATVFVNKTFDCGNVVNNVKNVVIYGGTGVVSQALEDEVKNIDNAIDISKLNDTNEAIKDGNVVMISTINSQGNEDKNEVYNTKKLDQFIKNFNNLKEDKVRIIKYAKQGNKVWINKLADIKYDGKNLTYVTYDTYSGSNIITEGSISVSFAKIVKTCSNNNVRYTLLEDEDTKEDMGVTVLSFSSDSIKN
ncbi:cell wall-binding repeat-containing protein [Clostridium kluyveri]|uniref:cell wall-binding repeat-containing protein n=1 Tax=Clostridium kluyveri TaxID=1534 RepID=UPI0022467C57|nr:cell wall-binding repeat-containing protein [Clostridium kluyveri]UZQ52251.1 cell wall-binding repeat-containing protein [Clostridium kluyveri]